MSRNVRRPRLADVFAGCAPRVAFARWLAVAIVVTATQPVCAEGMGPREALRVLEAHPFAGDKVRPAVRSLQAAARSDPEDPWALLGLARANLVLGYRSGSWFSADSFDEARVDKAQRLVDRALAQDDELSRAYAMQARLQMIAGDYKKAWRTLSRAHELAPDAFYPWYIHGVLHRYYERYDKGRELLQRAQANADHDYQVRWVLRARIDYAEDLGDTGLEERLRREVISRFDDRAHAYGNYGAFLLEQDRYQEAIEQFEKALSIQRYPLAKRQLEKARRLAEENQ